MSINTEFASKLGAEMAAQLNSNPAEAQNWSPLESGDDVPEFDCIALRENYGDEFDANIRAIEKAYKAAFNSVFEPLDSDV